MAQLFLQENQLFPSPCDDITGASEGKGGKYKCTSKHFLQWVLKKRGQEGVIAILLILEKSELF